MIDIGGSRIRLRANGTVLLGDHVSCDGFAYDYPVRVQTHIHHDHMVDFDTSKANQKLIMSLETKQLLVAMMNADLPYRTNIEAVEYESAVTVNGDLIELFRSHHMLGAVQVRVTNPDGYRIGYSSDFFWPIESAIDVDELIVDATYGDPNRIRDYAQNQIDDLVIEKVTESLRKPNSTAVIGYNGRLQQAMHLLNGIRHVPILVSPKAFRLLPVYSSNGYEMPHVLVTESSEAIEILRNREKCLVFITFPERRHLPWVDRLLKITLSAYRVSTTSPLTDYGNGDCCIAFTDHADYYGTIEYIRASGASLVWTDPRTGNADALADAVRRELGLKCMVAPQDSSHAWG